MTSKISKISSLAIFLFLSFSIVAANVAPEQEEPKWPAPVIRPGSEPPADIPPPVEREHKEFSQAQRNFTAERTGFNPKIVSTVLFLVFVIVCFLLFKKFQCWRIISNVFFSFVIKEIRWKNK
jgi:hypothetical protein